MHTLRVGAIEKIIRPGCIIDVAGLGRASDVRFAAAPELALRARTAVGAGDEQHQTGSMRDGRGRRLVDEATGAEAVECEGGGDWMRFALGDGVREDVAGPGRRLESAGAPAAVDVEARDRREPDDG